MDTEPLELTNDPNAVHEATDPKPRVFDTNITETAEMRIVEANK